MTDDGDWQGYFPFPEPYEAQSDAAERIRRAGESRGYLATEGPCGTGKTAAALSAGAALVRETSLYDRIFVVTPVKQQLEQFVADLRAINGGLDEPLDGIALVGKRDLCPYEREGRFGDASVNERCRELREATAELVEGDEGPTQAAVAEAVAEDDSDDQWWDPRLGSDLAKAARPAADGGATLSDEVLSTAGVDSPYRPEQPAAPAEMDESEPLYCPFEADWYARNCGSPFGFDAGDRNVLTAEDYLPTATERGTCPHRAMGVLMEEAEVVIGNYNHLFDPSSRLLTESLLDDRTFVVVDEAHRLEGRVRDLLSDRLGRQTMKQARGDCSSLLTYARQSREGRTAVEDALAAREVPLEAVERVRDFLDDAVDWLDDRVERFLDAEHEGWRANPAGLPETDREIPLRDPETTERDAFTEWAERAGYHGSFRRTVSTVGAAVEDALDQLGVGRQPVVAAATGVLGSWWARGHDHHLREVVLDAAPTDPRRVETAYQAAYNPALYCYNCMPGPSLRDAFDELGGGVLMSATLEPLDVFARVSGLEALAAGDDGARPDADGGADDGAADAADDESGRPVETATYDLSFPPENRASYLVDATPFTARNRGDPGAMEPLGEGWNDTRDEYAHALRTLSRSPGNVLVAMPNYREARWAGAYLDGAVDKPVLVDESSSNEATERRKRRFFRGEGKVLVTSARGTLTEGVDYDGEKLSTCAVVGVPLVNVGSPRVRAVRRAYGEAFGSEHAFEYALTVPAVRRARQAIGRVIRGADEVGVRALVGRRYVPGARHSVHEHLAAGEREEFVRMTTEFLGPQLERFWDERAP